MIARVLLAIYISVVIINFIYWLVLAKKHGLEITAGYVFWLLVVAILWPLVALGILALAMML